MDEEYLERENSSELLMDLLDGLSSAKNSRELGMILKDLMTYKEIMMIAKRIRIAELVKKNRGYRQISGLLGAGQGTVSRVQEWMKISSEGYELLLDRIEAARKTRPTLSDPKFVGPALKRFMQRYPLTFWPELAIFEISKIPAKKRNKEMRQLTAELRKKARLYRQIEHEIRRDLRTYNRSK